MFGSITGKPATGSIFGSTTSAPASSGLLGAAPASQAPSSGLFGSSTSQATATTSAPQGGGIFGSTQPATGSLFGSTTTATSSQPQTTGLFGSTLPASGSLLGSTPTTTAASSQPQTTGIFGSTLPASGSLFGSTTTATSSQPQTSGLFGTTQPATGGLFGSTPATTTSATTTTSQPQTTGLFSIPGSQAATTQPTTQTGLLGATPAATISGVSSGSVFGASIFGTSTNQTKTSEPQQSTLGSSLLGGSLSLGKSTNQQQSIPGVLIDASNIRGTTRYNDLKEELQKQIMDVDTMIQNQIQLQHECDAIMPAHDSQLARIPADVEFCQRKLTGVDGAVDEDIQSISAVQKLIKADVEAAKLSFAAIDILRLPPQYHTHGAWSVRLASNQGDGGTEDIVGFFSQVAEGLGAKLTMYQKQLTEIEQHLRGVEFNSAQQINTLIAKKNGSAVSEESSYEQLAGVLQDFEAGLLNVAGKVGETRKMITALQLNQFGPAHGNLWRGNR
ncbi:hypothetical protein K3495_g1275 [Podosphaera aphanis]|nr:hypothetical protein K3495_g1275 [Podosphaera aphanis]